MHKPASVAILLWLSIGVALAASWRTVYETDWRPSIDRGLMLQCPSSDSIVTGTGPDGRAAVHVTLRRSDNYQGVANGVPRAEISFIGRARLARATLYRIRWSTYIPTDNPSDAQQPEGVSQIHPGAAKAGPVFGLTLVGDRFRVVGMGPAADVGAADKGRWIEWDLQYRGDASGTTAIYELRRDGALVLSLNGRPDAAPGDDGAYFKVGIYKWDWQKRASDVTVRNMWFGPVHIEQSP